jgi:hypothetical protein
MDKPLPVPDFMKNLVAQRQQAPSLPLLGPSPDGSCPQPLPLSVTWTHARTSDGKDHVVLQFSTAAGVQFYFLTPDLSKQMGQGLLDAGLAAGSGIQLVKAP